EAPVLRGALGQGATGWSEALSALTEALRGAEGGVKAVVSAGASNEDLGALRALMDALGGGEMVYRSVRVDDEDPLPGYPDLARRRELAPNGRGAELLGARRVGDADGTGGLEDVASHRGVVIVLGDPLTDQAPGFARDAALTLYLGVHPSAALAEAHAELPITTFAEAEGTFTNLRGRVQRFWPGLLPPGAARPAWLVLGAVAAALTDAEAPRTAAEAFARLGEVAPAFRGLTYEALGERGALAGEPAQLSSGD
ncbi:MAG: hypothetical protein D6701_02480, partial [Gemmatimonadetes bacterium]